MLEETEEGVFMGIGGMEGGGRAGWVGVFCFFFFFFWMQARS